VKVCLAKEYIHIDIVGRQGIVPDELFMLSHPEKILKDIDETLSAIYIPEALYRNHNTVEL
jgi:hypothetical protein